MKPNTYPSLPNIFQLPVKYSPLFLRKHVISKALNILFSEQLKNSELDFLINKKINIKIIDLGLELSLSLVNNIIKTDRKSDNPDLFISGKVYSFLLLGTRKEDTDTLFFHRQITSVGDTELGLFVKNFLDALEPESLPAHALLDTIMNHALKLADNFASHSQDLPFANKLNLLDSQKENISNQ